MPVERDTWQYVVDLATIALPFVAIIVTVAAYLLTYLRRPSVSLHEDTHRIHSHLEGADNDWPHVRILAANLGWRRAAQQTQVVVIGCRRVGQPENEMKSLGSPVLGWPSAGATNNLITIFPGMSRPVDLGWLYPAKRDRAGRLEVHGRYAVTAADPGGGIPPPVVHLPSDGGQWQFRIGLGIAIADYREYLPPGDWIIRLVIGADDGAAATYDVHVSWRGDAADAQEALEGLLDHLQIMKV